MELWQEQVKFTNDVGRLIRYIFEHGYVVTLGEAWRSPETAEIYAREGKGIVRSLHCDRLAIDLNLFSNSGKYLTDFQDWEFAGKFWEAMDQQNRWGGRFKPLVDMNHFERHII